MMPSVTQPLQPSICCCCYCCSPAHAPKVCDCDFALGMQHAKCNVVVVALDVQALVGAGALACAWRMWCECV